MYRRPACSCLSECLDDNSYGMPQDLVSLCIRLVWAVIVDDALLQVRLGRPIGSFVLFLSSMIRWYSSLVGRIFYFRMPVPNAGRTSSFTDHISLFRTMGEKKVVLGDASVAAYHGPW